MPRSSPSTSVMRTSAFGLAALVDRLPQAERRRRLRRGAERRQAEG